jgi:hypothetical protein
MIRIASLLIALVVTSSIASAGRRAGVTMRDTITLAGKTLVLNGMGVREATWLKVDVYVAGLYVENVSSNPAELVSSDEVKVIVLHFKRDVGRADITKAWNDGFTRNATVPLTEIRPLITRLNSWMPSFDKGDTLTFTVIPRKGVAVDINGARKGVLGDDDFARSLVSIWLGPNPPTTALKSGLLGRHAGA